jgi:hypothetical protein
LFSASKFEAENKIGTWNVEVSKATSPQNDRFKAIRTATMGDEEIADEGVPRSAHELQALAIHAKDHAC